MHAAAPVEPGGRRITDPARPARISARLGGNPSRGRGRDPDYDRPHQVPSRACPAARCPAARRPAATGRWPRRATRGRCPAAPAGGHRAPAPARRSRRPLVIAAVLVLIAAVAAIAVTQLSSSPATPRAAPSVTAHASPAAGAHPSASALAGTSPSAGASPSATGQVSCTAQSSGTGAPVTGSSAEMCDPVTGLRGADLHDPACPATEPASRCRSAVRSSCWTVTRSGGVRSTGRTPAGTTWAPLPLVPSRPCVPRSPVRSSPPRPMQRTERARRGPRSLSRRSLRCTSGRKCRRRAIRAGADPTVDRPVLPLPHTGPVLPAAFLTAGAPEHGVCAWYLDPPYSGRLAAEIVYASEVVYGEWPRRPMRMRSHQPIQVFPISPPGSALFYRRYTYPFRAHGTTIWIVTVPCCWWQTGAVVTIPGLGRALGGE